MHLDVVKESKGYTVGLDGINLTLTGLPLDRHVSALHYDFVNQRGEMEFEDCKNNPNQPITNPEIPRKIAQLWEREADRIDAQEEEHHKQWMNSWARIRAYRGDLFEATDWMVLPDSPLSDEEREQLKEYRNALRDITNRFDHPQKVVWPSFPIPKYINQIPALIETPCLKVRESIK